jgi:hypothetical protein
MILMAAGTGPNVTGQLIGMVRRPGVASHAADIA